MMASCDVEGEGCARRLEMRDGRGVERRFGICAISLMHAEVEVLMLEEGGFLIWWLVVCPGYGNGSWRGMLRGWWGGKVGGLEVEM